VHCSNTRRARGLSDNDDVPHPGLRFERHAAKPDLIVRNDERILMITFFWSTDTFPQLRCPPSHPYLLHKDYFTPVLFKAPGMQFVGNVDYFMTVRFGPGNRPLLSLLSATVLGRSRNGPSHTRNGRCGFTAPGTLTRAIVGRSEELVVSFPGGVNCCRGG
jgi:hypothetical protein